MGKLEGKVALVTGASRGIGAGIAQALAAEGAAVVVNYAASPAAAESVVEAIRGAGGQAVAMAGNVADPAAARALVDGTVEQLGRLDVLVNNAGITRDRAISGISDEQWNEVLAVNLTGAFSTTRALYPHLRKQRGGTIINVSSVVARTGNAGQANYVAAKAGLIGLTKATALEIARFGATCNALLPGFIETDMTAGLHEKIRAGILERIPLGRYGTVEDVARAALFLAADAPYMTGQCLDVNGGLAM